MASTDLRIFIGFDPREMVASAVADYSVKRHASAYPDTSRLALSPLTLSQIYRRPMHLMPDGITLWDEYSDAPMSTEHAIARFFVPYLCGYQGWALFVDGDVLFRNDIFDLWDYANPNHAVVVVQHPPMFSTGTKKAGQIQTAYPRKNWSSVMLWNCAHPAHTALTLEVLNTWPGRDLHAFRWLRDDQIGALPPEWNHLVNISPPSDTVTIAHFTLGTPNLTGHAQDPYADEWFRVAKAAGYRFDPPQVSA